RIQYKRRQDGLGQEYFYAYDCTGGRSSGPGIKTFVNIDVQHLTVADTTFTPRFEIEVPKAGELHARTSFGGNGRQRRVSGLSSPTRVQSGTEFSARTAARPFPVKDQVRGLIPTRISMAIDALADAVI
ncbi:MAG: hypothetical protein LC775_00920, partial [Acidobacteria bacterium]|nr:hypothetical protein [Acidobacteriota bacterium]